jgi:hypothetical protein
MRNAMVGIDLWRGEFADYPADMRKLFCWKGLRLAAIFALE